MGTEISEMVEIDGHVLKLSNLDKVFWPDEQITKARLIKYYFDMAPFILPIIRNRPLVLKRYPHGIEGDFFYQKECPSYAPEWVETFPIKHSHKVINYLVCNNTATLIWMANQGCLEIHGWLSRVENIDSPDLAVIDLDPAEGASFRDVLKVARIIREALDAFGIKGFPKTSGSAGLHIFIPLSSGYTFEDITKAVKCLAEIIVNTYPNGVTIERAKSKRTGKVYLDYLQNGRGKTMAFPYSLRPLPGAPVSMPVSWEEVEQMKIAAGGFSLLNARSRVVISEELTKIFFQEKQNIDELLNLGPSAPATGNTKMYHLDLPLS
ncbi:bifunctional non-homologous end joining protein LigD [Desulfotomaculum arcticum]|uniref:Bifunctional non-homologous end joining protein LigD n=1 Tax=Desulfotruncus arcticus DSM 17038 TaxID=1121424 RepID=A0A1I2SBU6_9FIRM|nr:non-homologous end-joining DNA ligase [Desulfotruncus arcticus]SFG50335.1 bifunctional non-homologous end joining protein LigD [Desulfotomaculum arcticum] [Desulfotruncus arcticus DSM 17038]